MLTSAVRKMLLTLGYPKLEKSHHLIGPHKHIGALQVRIPDATNCQIFYPAASVVESKEKSKELFTPYWRPEAVQGLVDYLRFGDSFLQMLSETTHPCHVMAEPLVATQDFPLVLFSHGLAGSFEMYTELCQHMASLGYCVVALEHEDGSAAYAEMPDGNAIPYKRPDDTPYSRQKVLKLRTPMLQQRVSELERIVRYFQTEKQKPAVYDDNEKSQLLSKIIDVTDPSRIHLVGHSFGGATQMLATQQWTTSASVDKLLQPKSLTVLDAWAFALKETVVQQGLKQRQGVDKLPFLSVISEGWTSNPERQPILDFLRNSASDDNNDIHSYVAEHSMHQSFSDSEAWFPSPVAKRIYNRGKREARHATIRSVVHAWGNMVSGTDDIVADDESVLKPFSFQAEDEQADKQQPTLLETGATASSITATAQ